MYHMPSAAVSVPAELKPHDWTVRAPAAVSEARVNRSVSAALLSPANSDDALSALEASVAAIGIGDGKAARSRSALGNFLVFLTRGSAQPLASSRLEALRAYAEMARALFPRSVPTTSLVEANFSANQIGGVLAQIAAASAKG